jgi:hypothetical protein
MHLPKEDSLLVSKPNIVAPGGRLYANEAQSG